MLVSWQLTKFISLFSQSKARTKYDGYLFIWIIWKGRWKDGTIEHDIRRARFTGLLLDKDSIKGVAPPEWWVWFILLRRLPNIAGRGVMSIVASKQLLLPREPINYCKNINLFWSAPESAASIVDRWSGPAIDSFQPATKAVFWRRVELSPQRLCLTQTTMRCTHVAQTRTSRSTGRSLALCCVLVQRHVTRRHFLQLRLFQSPREGEEPETAALMATRRLDRLGDQLPEMIRLWPGIFLTALQTLFSSHISLRESFNKSIFGWKWFLQLFIIVVARGLSRLVRSLQNRREKVRKPVLLWISSYL